MIVISGRSLLFPAQPLQCEEWQGAIFFTAQVQGSGSDQKAAMSIMVTGGDVFILI